MSEFNPKLGSFLSGTVAAIIGLIKYVAVPSLIFFILPIMLKGMGEASVWSPILQEMGTLTLIFAPLLVLFSFLHGFYPSGSYSRVVFAIICVALLAAYGFSLLLDGRVQSAFHDQGIDINVMLLFYFLLISLALALMCIIGELFDGRRDFQRLSAVRLGTKEPSPDVLENVNEHRVLHDFRLRYGRYVPGFNEARRSLSRFIIWPVVMFMIITAALVKFNELSSVGFEQDLTSTTDILWLIGVPLVVLGFFKGFYPKGSLSRMVAWMIMAALICMWIWYFTLTGIVNVSLIDLATVDLDFRWIVILFMIAAALWALYALVEMFSYRQDWMANNFHPVDEARAKKDRELRKAQRRMERQRSKEEAKGKK